MEPGTTPGTTLLSEEFRMCMDLPFAARGYELLFLFVRDRRVDLQANPADLRRADQGHCRARACSSYTPFISVYESAYLRRPSQRMVSLRCRTMPARMTGASSGAIRFWALGIEGGTEATVPGQECCWVLQQLLRLSRLETIGQAPAALVGRVAVEEPLDGMRTSPRTTWRPAR
jgi:hypothetical protein